MAIKVDPYLKTGINTYQPMELRSYIKGSTATTLGLEIITIILTGYTHKLFNNVFKVRFKTIKINEMSVCQSSFNKVGFDKRSF